MVRALTLVAWLLGLTLAQLPQPYRSYQEALMAGDVASLERLLDAEGYVQILAARSLSRRSEISPSRRLGLAERAARFENAASDWLWVGRLREVLGDAPGAAEAYAGALPQPEAEAALVRLARAGVKRAYTALYAGRAYEALLEALPAEGEAAWRARALAGLHRYAEALPFFRAWAQGSREGRLALGHLLFELERYPEAAAAFRVAGGAEGAYGRGRALEALGKRDAAVRAYLEARTPAALWRATELLERAGRVAEALPLYRRLAEGSSVYADDALLRLWVLARRRGDTALEAWAYDRLEGGLAVMAGKPLEGVPRYDKDKLYAETLEGYIGLDRVSGLLDAGREKWAWGEARWWVREVEAGRAPAKLRYLIGRELASHGFWHQSLKLVPSRPKTGFVPYWRVAYPRAYEREVLVAVEHYGLEPELVWAVMRVESRFDPQAVSPTGARGLMQFVRATWNDVARRLGEEGADPFDPEAAVRFGAYYLRWLLDGCDRELVCTLASYNGGPGYTRRGLAAVGGDIWDFMRFQPRDEPREYVERVLYAYAVYKALY